jgi:type I restriction enzyme S subunit
MKRQLLGTVLKRIAGGGTPSKAVDGYFDGDIPFATVKDFQSRRPTDTQDHITKEALHDSAAELIPPNTLLLTTRMAIGRLARFACPVAINQDVKAIFPGNAIDDDYLEWFLLSASSALEAQGTGTTVRGIRLADIQNLTVPLPTLTKQKRIAARLEALFRRSKSAHEELARVPGLIERYKQTVLESAFAGSLTSVWRQGQASSESGSNLLDRIKTARLARAETKKERSQIEIAFSKNNLTPKEGEFGTLANIPDSWAICRVGAIGTVCNGSTPSRSESKFWRGSVPWVSSGEVRNNTILETRECITAAGYENSSVRLLPEGTVLLAMIGEGKTRGQTSVLGIKATINQNIAAVLLEHGLVLPRFLWQWFQLQYQQTRRRGAGNGPKALNCQAVREIPFVLPPLAEQQEIVTRIDAALKRIEGATADIKRTRILLDRLDQATLAKAFPGELF